MFTDHNHKEITATPERIHRELDRWDTVTWTDGDVTTTIGRDGDITSIWHKWPGCVSGARSDYSTREEAIAAFLAEPLSLMGGAA